MESSPQSNHPPIDKRDALLIAHIDAAVAEWDVEHRRIDGYLAQGLVAKEVEVIPVINLTEISDL